MRISMKSDYGIRAVLDLAQRFGEGPVQSGDIAGRQGIPEPYLEQLLTTLRKAGLIRSVRGPQGGHSLIKTPQEISVAEVIMALEGSIAPIDCIHEVKTCKRSQICVQRDIWKEIDEITQKYLDATTIASLLERQSAREAQSMYYI